jgi:serine/threonine protein phosphatase PrpC
MSLLQRRRSTRLDEGQLLSRARAGAADMPPVLAAGGAEPWSSTPATRDRLLEALEVYADNDVPLRVRQVDSPRWLADVPESRRLIHLGLVRLRSDDGSADVPVPDLLDANVLFARLARFNRSWEVRPPHAWSEWDVGVAWAEEQVDPHGGLFDLPPGYRAGAHADQPLFGWRLDLAWGARVSAHGVPVVRMSHSLAVGHRTVTLFDLPKCFHRGQSPMERLRSRPVRLPPPHGWGRVVEIDVADRAVEVQPDAPSGQAAQALPLDAVLVLNPDLEPMLAALRDQALVELRRRLEAHAAARGEWLAGPELRASTGRTQLPLTGWQLGADAFVALERGEVRMSHPRVPDGLVVSARAAWRMMADHVDPALRLHGDPCVDGRGNVGFLRAVVPEGCLLTRGHDDDMLSTGWTVGHAAFLRANPDLVEPLLQECPDLGMWSEDSELREALRERLPDELAALAPLAELLAMPAPIVATPLARELAEELLDRPDLDVPLRTADSGRGEWIWTAMTPAGRFRFVQTTAGPRHRLTGPVRGGEVLDVAPPPDELSLTAEQLVFTHPALARRIVAWQRASGLIDDAGAPVSPGDRLGVVVQRSVATLLDAHQRTRQHIRLSRELREDPRRARALEAHLERIEANLGDLRGGHTVRAWIDEGGQQRVGLAVAAGGAGGGGNRALDDRIRLTDFIETRFLGPFRLILVGGGDPAYEVPAGPLISRLLDDLEQRVAFKLRDVVDLTEAAEAARDAILEGSAAAGRQTPFCSLVAALVHRGSGRTAVLWSGNSGAWRVRAQLGQLDRLTWDHTAEGLAALAADAGLRPEDAVACVLQLTLRKTTRRDLETVTEEQLVATAERFMAVARRRAVRAGLGGARAALFDEHDRLLTLMRTWQDAYDRHVELGPVEAGAGMLFVRHVRLRRGDRLVLATDGLAGLIERSPLLALRALTRGEPQRAAEWLGELASGDSAADDLALVVVDPEPDQPWTPEFTRRQGVVHRRTTRQDDVLEGGVIPAVGDGPLPALRIRPRQLARFEAEIDELIRKRKLTAPEAGLEAFIEGVARWACAREAERPLSRRPGEELRELDEVLDERDDDPADELAITFWILRRRRVPVTWRTGLRVPRTREAATEGSWLELVIGAARYVIDPLARPVLRPLQGDSAVRGLLAGFTKAVAFDYVPIGCPVFEVPVAEVAYDEAPWMRVGQSAQTAAPSRPGPGRATPAPGRAEPPPEPPKPAASGWLDLD